MADIMILMDTSDSHGPDAWSTSLGVISGLIETLGNGYETNRIGLVDMSDNARVTVPLNNRHTVGYLLQHVLSLERDYRGVELSRALRMTLEHVFSESRHRVGIANIWIIIADENVTDDVTTLFAYAQQVKQRGVTIITIGIGQYADYEVLTQLASNQNMTFRLGAMDVDATSLVFSAYDVIKLCSSKECHTIEGIFCPKLKHHVTIIIFNIENMHSCSY